MLSESSISRARSMACQSAIRTSRCRYSPPCIGGALSISAIRSLAAGGGRSRRSSACAVSPSAQRSATKRKAKSRHHARDDGRLVPASPAPSCRRPWPEPRVKHFSSRSSEPVFQRKFAFDLIEAERAMRRQHRNERARHIPKSILPVSPILFAYHEIGRVDPHIPTKFTRSRLVISANYATLANPELRRRRRKGPALVKSKPMRNLRPAVE